MILPPQQAVRTAIQQALQEDAGSGDVTTTALFPTPCTARATLIARQHAVAAGVTVARNTFLAVDPSLHISHAAEEGTPLRDGVLLLEITGDARSLLMAERVALNFLQRLSGIATLTAQFCHAVRGYRTKILDTRKTTPGLRLLEKWAVRIGGGHNHRQNLGDGVLIKDNHLSLLHARGGSVADACRLAREHAPHGLRIIVEVDRLAQVREALDGKADVILLDNMTPDEVHRAVDLIKGRALVEVSGGMTLSNVREMAAAGADFISIGALTHSAPAVDISMELEPLRPKSSRRRTP
jgi:nicotinate-nucleotide pyrophosphorylase (carboxylating)